MDVSVCRFPLFQAVLKRSRHAHSIIVTADQVAMKNGKICEKPTTKEQCHAYLNSYCNSYVELYSAICVYNSETEKRYTCCDVSRVDVAVWFTFHSVVCRYSNECSRLFDRKGRCVLLLWRNHCGGPKASAVHYSHRRNGSRTAFFPTLHSRLWDFLCNVSSTASIWPVFLFDETNNAQKQHKKLSIIRMMNLSTRRILIRNLSLPLFYTTWNRLLWPSQLSDHLAAWPSPHHPQDFTKPPTSTPTVR